MPQDELVPTTVWLYAVLPPPRFPAAAADKAFASENVVGTSAEVATIAFRFLEDWGFRAIGRHHDVENDVDAVAYSSKSATIWIVVFTGLLSVLVTPEPEVDPSRLNHHLAARRADAAIAVWGAFPLQARHVPAAARTFQQAGKDLLHDGAPNFDLLGKALEAATTGFSRAVQRRENWATAQELARAGRHRAVVRILSYWASELQPEQRAFLDAERHAAETEAPLLERGSRSDRDWFIARAELLTAKDRDLKSSNRGANAVTDFHDAKDLLYEDLELAITRAKSGDREATIYLITFLEADPWCFRSGYMKGKLYELLRRVNCDDSVRLRLRAVLLRLVDAGYRLEFRSACRLARQMADSDLIGDLRRRLTASPDRHVRRRALWMLSYAPNGLEDQDRHVLNVLLEATAEEDWWRASGWAHRLCRRFGSDEFDAKIRGLALSSDDTSARRGLRLLPSAIRQPLDAGERLALESIILEAVQERGPAVGLMEGLAAIADTRRLRIRLAELAQHADSPVSSYARWALNAAIRANGEQAPDL
jgi:hypothetical protein